MNDGKRRNSIATYVGTCISKDLIAFVSVKFTWMILQQCRKCNDYGTTFSSLCLLSYATSLLLFWVLWTGQVLRIIVAKNSTFHHNGKPFRFDFAFPDRCSLCCLLFHDSAILIAPWGDFTIWIAMILFILYCTVQCPIICIRFVGTTVLYDYSLNAFYPGVDMFMSSQSLLNLIEECNLLHSAAESLNSVLSLNTSCL